MKIFIEFYFLFILSGKARTFLLFTKCPAQPCFPCSLSMRQNNSSLVTWTNRTIKHIEQCLNIEHFACFVLVVKTLRVVNLSFSSTGYSMFGIGIGIMLFGYWRIFKWNRERRQGSFRILSLGWMCWVIRLGLTATFALCNADDYRLKSWKSG